MRLGLAAGVALVTLAGAYILWSRAAAPVAKAEEHVVRVGVYENAPKVYLDRNGAPAGLFVSLIKEIAGDEGWRLEFIVCEWQDCLERTAAGEIDLMPDVAYSNARSRILEFHRVPVTYSWSVILTPVDSPPPSLPDLDRRRIALLAGSVQTRPLDALMAGSGLSFTAIGYPTYAEAFAAVRDGDADAVVSNSYHAGAFARRYGLRETPIVFNPATLYFATPKGDPLGLLPSIDEHLEAWRFDEHSVYYSALKAAMVPVQEAVVPPMLRYLLIGIGGLLLLFLAMSAVLRWQVWRKTAELRETAHRLDHMLHSSPVVLYQLAMDEARISTRWVSDNLQRLFGLGPDEFIEADRWPRQLHPEDREAVLNNLAVLPEKGHLVQEYRILDAQGNTRFVRDEMQFLPGQPGHPDEIVGSWNDLTESREQAERVSFLTHYDPLTGLPNRALLHERLTHAIYRARRERRSLALLCVDLDRFKVINDALGNNVGDAVLKAVADRLTRGLHASDILARTGGDGFVLLLEDDAGQNGAAAMAENIMAQLKEPFHVGDQDVVLTASVGTSLYPADGEDADSLLHHAEAALFDAKSTGRNTHRLYSSSLAAGLAQRLTLESGLRGAVARGELVLHYQPQVDLVSRQLVGVEALVRWQHPEIGLVSPARFIPIAEEIGVIGEIGAWVLEAACRQMLNWRAQGLAVPHVAVNLSVQQIDADTLIPLVRQILDKTGLHPSSLELEVTESIIMREPEKATAALEGFRAMGIQLAVDDFGTGYSSLNYLKHLPIDRLKIDQSFVRDIGNDSNSEAISRAIIGLARSLELEVVAEGIEQDHQLEFLRREGCPVGQGYLFSPPVPGERLAELWRKLAQN